jgi:hypothetical protein
MLQQAGVDGPLQPRVLIVAGNGPPGGTGMIGQEPDGGLASVATRIDQVYSLNP